MTPHTASPAPIATTKVCKILIAEVKNAIFYVSPFKIFLFIFLNLMCFVSKTHMSGQICLRPLQTAQIPPAS